MSRCRDCRQGRCEDCQTLGLGCPCCRGLDAPHLDPCDCDDCRAAVEHATELHFQTLREDTP